ncbi:MAG: sporulation protein YqfC [Solirubrobacterales bacterium]
MGNIGYRTRQSLASALELPEDIILNKPKITVTGKDEIIIENHKGIILFQEEVFRVNSEAGMITIYGTGFEILFMGGSTIIISGRFKSIVYEDIQ